MIKNIIILLYGLAGALLTSIIPAVAEEFGYNYNYLINTIISFIIIIASTYTCLKIAE